MAERYAWTAEGMEPDEGGQWIAAPEEDEGQQAQSMTNERIADIGHRYAWRYKHVTPDGPLYTFNAHCLRDLARAIERELHGGDPWSRVNERKSSGEPSSYERPPTVGVSRLDGDTFPPQVPHGQGSGKGA